MSTNIPQQQLISSIKTQFSRQEVQKHNQYGNLWVIIQNNVYDLSKFADLHPAGRNVIKEYAGQDVTDLFHQFHGLPVLQKYHEKLCIGEVTEKENIEYIIPIQKYTGGFGEGIPYGDPNNAQGWKSPYYNQTHHDLRKNLRAFLQKEIAPFIDQWDDKKQVPREVFKTIAQNGILGIVVGQPWQVEYFPNKQICGVKLDKPDYFHEIIVLEECVKYSSIGLVWAIGTCSIGLPPIINQGSEYLKNRYISQVLSGEKLICLCITEPWAGSDVANVKCNAQLSECGKYYIVNGMKKFITTGAYADTFTVAVRTGEDGFLGVSLLIIDRSMPGVKTRQMNMQGVWGSGTAFITFENVKVPVEHLVGQEGLGFLYIMQTFNHERFQQIIECVSASRVCLEESIKYAHRRGAFGKKLIDQPVIRAKIAEMTKDVESLQAYLELIAYNFQKMDKKQEKNMASAIAIAKAQGTVIFERSASTALQIFGGNGYQRGSVGSKIERFYREAKSLTLGGGTPEILLDMAIRQASKSMPQQKL